MLFCLTNSPSFISESSKFSFHTACETVWNSLVPVNYKEKMKIQTFQARVVFEQIIGSRVLSLSGN